MKPKIPSKLKKPVRRSNPSQEIAELKARLEEADSTLEAIRTGAVDALVVKNPEGHKVYTLQGADYGYQVMIETMPDGAVTVSANGEILYSNRGFAKLVEQPLENVIGKNISEFFLPEEYRAFQELLQQATKQYVIGRPLNLRRSSGQSFPAQISANILPNGSAPHICVVVSDLTERVRQEQALRRREEELHQARKIEAIGRLAGGVAHDFNNLIAGIMGISEDLKASLPAEDSRHEDIDEILKASQRAFGMTKQLLAFGRRQVIQTRVLNVNEVIQNTNRMLKRLIGEDIHLEMDLGDAGWIFMDAGLLEQVVMNLVLNARDALPQGGRITVRTHQEVFEPHTSNPPLAQGMYAILQVLDNGVGMSAETLSHIFEPFFTTKEKEHGTGLGLATVHGIVKQSGGEILVASHLGQGSQFKIYFPAVKPEDSVSVSAAAPALEKAASGTILVIEDEEIVRRVVVRLLKRAGYRVVEAAEGPQAFQVSQAVPDLDLIISDVILPGMNGKEIVEAIRSTHPQVQALFISGYPSDIITEKNLLHKGLSFLEKTDLQAGLLPRVRELLAVKAR